jgi:hypothetical protein
MVSNRYIYIGDVESIQLHQMLDVRDRDVFSNVGLF